MGKTREDREGGADGRANQQRRILVMWMERSTERDGDVDVDERIGRKK
jgi:hypothetical protein